MGINNDLWTYIKGGSGKADPQSRGILRRFVEAGADLHAVSDGNGRNALQHAVYYDSSHMIRPLIALGAKHDVTSPNGWQPLHDAAFNGRSAAIKELVNCGADINAFAPSTNGPQHPLAMALQNRFDVAAMTLLQLGADAQVTYGEHNKTMLHMAVRCDELDLIDRLRGAGLDLNARDKRGMTPLHCAALDGYEPQLIRLLLLGADPELTVDFTADKLQGKTALEIALESDNDVCAIPLRTFKAHQAARAVLAHLKPPQHLAAP